MTPPQPLYPTRILFDQRVEMRDGVTLSADVYLPDPASSGNGRRWPAILTRTPYQKADSNVLSQARWFAERGYAFVAMDVRGRGDSDGVFIPYMNEGRDGYDSIESAAAQPWCDGARWHDWRLVPGACAVAGGGRAAAAPESDDRARAAVRPVRRDAHRTAQPDAPLLAALHQRAAGAIDGGGGLGARL